MHISKVIIPVAGWGTRSLPVSKNVPKEMLPIYNKPTIQYIVEEAVESGIQDVVFITNKDKNVIEDYFDHNLQLEHILEHSGKNEFLSMVRNIAEMITVISIRQKRQLGLGHAILCAKKIIHNESFAVMLGDDIMFGKNKALHQLMAVAKEKNKTVIGVIEVPHDKINRYGIITGKELAPNLYQVKDMIEKPAIGSVSSCLAIAGRYILTPNIFEYLNNTKPGHGGEIQLTDALLNLAKNEEVLAVKLEVLRFDTGDWVDYISANVYYAMQNEKLKRELKTKIQTILQNIN